MGTTHPNHQTTAPYTIHTPETRTASGGASAHCAGVAGSAPSFFDKLPDRVYPRRIPGGIVFGWVRNGVGFGQLTLRVTRGRLEVDAECMGPDFCAEVIKQAISEALPNSEISIAPRAQKGKPNDAL